VLLAPTPLSGCYLAHLAHGQAQLLHASRPLDDVLLDPATPTEVREALSLVGPARRFARELGLDVGRQYTRYAPWPGDRVVTALVATRPGEIDAATRWFPIVGRVPYRGYFDRSRAERAAAGLAERGYDTCLVPVPAYSTLGWLPDPVPEPLLQRGPGFLVETLIHELVHATVFVADEADFNEGVATFIGQEAVVRFFASPACPEGTSAIPCGPEAGEAERRRVADERRIARELSALRARVEVLYREPASPERDAEREALSEQTREQLATLPLTSLSGVVLARSTPLHDACLALAATYEADLDAYALRLAAGDGDLAAFVADVRRAADSSDPRAALGLPPALPD
jgi:predicted aminopeptidase